MSYSKEIGKALAEELRKLVIAEDHSLKPKNNWDKTHREHPNSFSQGSGLKAKHLKIVKAKHELMSPQPDSAIVRPAKNKAVEKSIARHMGESETPEHKPEDFHAVLKKAGFTHARSLGTHDVFTHPTKPKVGVMHKTMRGETKMWDAHALTNGHTLDTPSALKAHLKKS